MRNSHCNCYEGEWRRRGWRKPISAISIIIYDVPLIDSICLTVQEYADLRAHSTLEVGALVGTFIRYHNAYCDRQRHSDTAEGRQNASVLDSVGISSLELVWTWLV